MRRYLWEPGGWSLAALLAGLVLLSCHRPTHAPAAPSNEAGTAGGLAAAATAVTWTPEPWKGTATVEATVQRPPGAPGVAAPPAGARAVVDGGRAVERLASAAAPAVNGVPSSLPSLDAPVPDPCGPKPLIAQPALDALVQAHLAGLRGVFGVAIKDLDSGEGVLVNAERELPAASLFKLPVMYGVYAERDAGRLSLADTLLLTARYAQYDLGTLEVRPGSAVRIGWALDRMITISDNATANLLLDRVGVANVNTLMRQLGLHETRITGERLSTSARDMLLLLELLALGQQPSAASSAEMVGLLLEQRVNDRIPARLPRDTRVAHKTGNLDGIVHDVGIVYSPAATFVIVLLAAETPNVGQVTQAQAALARAVYDYFNPADSPRPLSGLRPPSAAQSAIAPCAADDDAAPLAELSLSLAETAPTNDTPPDASAPSPMAVPSSPTPRLTPDATRAPPLATATPAVGAPAASNGVRAAVSR